MQHCWIITMCLFLSLGERARGGERTTGEQEKSGKKGWTKGKDNGWIHKEIRSENSRGCSATWQEFRHKEELYFDCSRHCWFCLYCNTIQITSLSINLWRGGKTHKKILCIDSEMPACYRVVLPNFTIFTDIKQTVMVSVMNGTMSKPWN